MKRSYWKLHDVELITASPCSLIEYQRSIGKQGIQETNMKLKNNTKKKLSKYFELDSRYFNEFEKIIYINTCQIVCSKNLNY